MIPCLLPPEVNIDPEEIKKLEQELASAQSMDLPEDDDLFGETILT